MASLVLFTIFHGILTLIALGIFLYALAMLLSNFTDSIYVPSGTKTVKAILDIVHPKRDSIFMDIGCGDGKVALHAARAFGTQSIGIDLNPILIAWACGRARMTKTRNAQFRIQNAFSTDLSRADYIYVFLLPKFIERLTPKFNRELKPGAMVISHGFEIKTWEQNLARTVPGKPFSTYIYRVPRA